MLQNLAAIYGRLLRGLIVLAAAGSLSAVTVQKAAKTAGESVRTGLISLKALNRQLGF